MNTRREWMLIFSIFLLASPVLADWLVTTAGARIETRGPWKLRGELVVFTSAEEVLSSLRVTEVDLEASELATAEALLPPEADSLAGEPKRMVAKVVITDADVRHVQAAVASADTTATGRAGGPIKKASQVILYSTSWCPYCRKARQVLSSEGVEFVEKDIEKDAEANREYLAKGNGYTGIPLIQIGERLLRGFNEEKILRALKDLERTSSAEIVH